MSILAYGGQVTAIGLLIVFTGLFILIFCISVMSRIFRAVTGKNKQPKAAEAPAPAPAPVQEATPVEEAPASEEEEITDPQLIAVIAAAIAAYDTNRTLVVRSVRRASGWKKTARDEAVCRF